jgi:hypothetical protein
MPLLEAAAFTAGLFGVWYYVTHVDPSDSAAFGTEPNLFGQFHRANLETNLGLNKLNHPQRGGRFPSYNYQAGSFIPPSTYRSYEQKQLRVTARSRTRKTDENTLQQNYFNRGTTTLTQAHNQGVAMQGPRFGKHHTGQTDITGYKHPFTHIPPVLHTGVEDEYVDK